MSDDLVRRLECYADLNDAVFHPWVYKEAADHIKKLEAQLEQSQLKRWAARWEEQSDRIEKLEAALTKFVSFYPMGISLELDQSFREARAALGEKKDER